MSEASFYAFLRKCDEDLATEARARGCRDCGGQLHRADYERRPRGGPMDLGEDHDLRFSFCCSRKGVCRARLTPASLRFLGPKVYLGAVVVLVTAMRHGPTPTRIDELRAATGASERTIARWRRWWQTDFALSPFFKAAAGRFATPVPRELLPRSLLERFGGEAREKLHALLEFISPITTATAGAGS